MAELVALLPLITAGVSAGAAIYSATKGDGGAAEAAKANQRRTLAQVAAQQGQLDQATATGARAKGGRLLTFINQNGAPLSGTGQSTLG